MKIKFNLWSFMFSFVCIVLFFISVSSYEMIQSTTNLLNVHPLNIVLTVSLVTFIFGLIGFSEVTNLVLLNKKRFNDYYNIRNIDIKFFDYIYGEFV